MSCKVCLRDAIQVYKLNYDFIELIEKLTEVKMGVNGIVCSFCLITLKKIQKFTDAVKEADMILKQPITIENNFESKKLYNLTLSTTRTISIDSSSSLYETDDCNVKEESNALKLGIVKEEPRQISEDVNDTDTDSEYEVPLINIADIKRENEKHMYESADNSGEILPHIQITCLSNEYEDKAVIELPLEEVTEQRVTTKKSSKGINKAKTNYKCSNRKNSKVNALSKQKQASESTSLKINKIKSVPKCLNTTEKPFSCKYCSSTFNRKNNLTTHLRTHTGEKPFFCDVCAHRSNTKNDLTRHIRTHTGEKPYACNVCSIKFSQKSHLTGHLKTHTGEKPFSCNICSYTSFHKNNLIRHIRTHTGEKPFSCNMCSYRCNNKSHLTTHLRTHTGEKPYSCDICPYKCTQKFFLTSHSRIHTGEKPFSCHICSYTCRTNCILKKHLTTHEY